MPDAIHTARHHINLFRSSVRAASNWADTLERSYARAFGSLVIAEDVHGIPAVTDLADRLMALRIESGLSAEQVTAAEKVGMAKADAATIQRQVLTHARNR